MCYESTKYSLNYVSAIQTVHTVTPESSLLDLEDREISWIVKLFSFGEAHTQVGHEIAVVLQLVPAYVNQPAQVLPLHILTFSMEIKPHILQPLVPELCVQLCELATNSQLGTLLVNQVDQVLRSIHIYGFFEVHFCGNSRVFKVFVDNYWR